MFSPELLEAIKAAGAALALLEAAVIVVLWRDIAALRVEVAQLHRDRLAEALQIVKVLEPTREQNELLAAIAEQYRRRR